MLLEAVAALVHSRGCWALQTRDFQDFFSKEASIQYSVMICGRAGLLWLQGTVDYGLEHQALQLLGCIANHPTNHALPLLTALRPQESRTFY